MFLTTRGLVLREVRYKESDKILTVLTQHEGKVTVRARGALRKGSRITAATQLLTYSDMTIFENRGRRTLNEASTVEEFLGLRADLGAFALGSYFAELLETVSAEEYPDPPVLQLAGPVVLRALRRARAGRAVALLARRRGVLCAVPGRELVCRHAAAAGDAGRHAPRRERGPKEDLFLHTRRRGAQAACARVRGVYGDAARTGLCIARLLEESERLI